MKPWTHRGAMAASIACIATVATLMEAGCGGRPVGTPATRAPATATPTATVAVSFAVRSTVAPAPRPSSTRTRQDRVAWISLTPESGPPVPRMLRVAGYHFPAGVTVQVAWAPAGTSVAEAATQSRVDRIGRFTALMSIPGTSPGWYDVVVSSADVHRRATAEAAFHVILSAHLNVSYTALAVRGVLMVRGRGFVPNTSLALSLSRVGGPRLFVTLVHVDREGLVGVRIVTTRLHPGQYSMATRTAAGASIQNVDYFFDVLF